MNKGCSPFVLHLCSDLNETVRQISSLNYSTDKSKSFLGIQCNLGLHFTYDPLLTASGYRFKFCERKFRFLKEGDNAAVKAIDSSVKNWFSWKWPDKCSELSFGKVELIKYQRGDCIFKKMMFPNCMVYVQ